MKRKYLFVLFVLSLIACKQENSEMAEIKIDIQGHRGARGLMPENTIPAFIKALELGITTLELDLAVTKDQQLIVSHEPYMNHQIALDTLGNEILKDNETAHNIYQMDYEQIKKYDVGSKFVKRFPNQEKIKVHKPLFKEVVDAVNQYSKQNNLGPIYYNIEIKCLPVGDNVYHPTPEVFSDLVYSFIQEHLDPKQVNVQSFDFRVLKYFKKQYPEIKLAVLIENALSIDENLDELGFIPEIYSCYHPLLDSTKVKYLHSINLKVIPWTVNEPSDIRSMLDWNVDGIISDYPDRVLNIVKTE